MVKEKLEKLLKHITALFNNEVMNNPKFFLCWENTDRKWEYDDDKIEYMLSSDVDQLTYVYIHFLYDPHEDKLQLIRSGMDVRDCVMWETSNASELTELSDFSELIEIFRHQMSLWYDCLVNIKEIEDKANKEKRVWRNTMHNIARDIFKYEEE